MARVDLKGVGKRFGSTRALDRIDLAIEDGEFLALLGPSGCGKTTLLRLVAGFEAPDEGEIGIGGVLSARAGWALPPEDRNIAMVFQSYALWPHMSVAENVGFSLRVRRIATSERRRRVEEALALVGLADVGERRPHELSGGQRQRVALARCMAMRPGVILLDEPLANLDAHLRGFMQAEFRRLHRELGVTFIYVTHDQNEALALADRVAVMDGGRIEQVSPPLQLFNQPMTPMVATFLGRGMVLPATVLGPSVTGALVQLSGTRACVRGCGRAGENRFLCVRPDELVIDAHDGIRCLVETILFQGASTLVEVRSLDGGLKLVIECRNAPPHPNDIVAVKVTGGWLLPTDP